MAWHAAQPYSTASNFPRSASPGGPMFVALELQPATHRHSVATMKAPLLKRREKIEKIMKLLRGQRRRRHLRFRVEILRVQDPARKIPARVRKNPGQRFPCGQMGQVGPHGC